MLISFEDLKQWLGYERAADIRKLLDKHGVQYLPSKKGVCTTLEWVEQSKSQPEDDIAEI